MMRNIVYVLVYLGLSVCAFINSWVGDYSHATFELALLILMELTNAKKEN